jgi:ribonuclease J
MTEETLVYVPLGGAGEIGMNMYLYGYGTPKNRRWLMVDCGVAFGDMKSTPGIELIMPDTAFLKDAVKKLDGICITHAHEDHVGAIGHLFERLNAPIYATKFTANIIKRKLHEQYIEAFTVTTCASQEAVRIGAFEVTFFPVTHSVPDAQGVSIKTPLGRILHTADFAISTVGDDPYAIWKRMAQEKTLCLVCDSTNVFERTEKKTENDIKESFKSLIAQTKGAVAATTFASNVDRLRIMARVAVEQGRSVVVGGRAMQRMISTALETGVINDFPPVLSDVEAQSMSPEHLFYLITGSQGEDRAALARIASNRHPAIKLGKGDLVIFSSKTIPGNEVEVTTIYNNLIENGVRVVDDGDYPVHISGHATQDQISEVHKIIQPDICIPMHGEYRHLSRHADLARENGIPEAHIIPNGRMLQIAPGKPKEVDWIETGRLYLDGKRLIGDQSGIVRDRLNLARQGIVFIALTLDENGDLLSDPDVHLSGIPDEYDSYDDTLTDMIVQEVDETIEQMSKRSRHSDEELIKTTKQAARRISNAVWGKKPNVIVSVTRLEDDFED